MKMNAAYIIKNADEIWHEIRWTDGIKCTNCDCDEYYRLSDGRYKCKKCGRIYSDVSGTLLHHSKVEKWKWLWCIYKMSSSKGISNVELARDVDVNIKTAWLMQQKVRFALDQEQVKLSGDIMMDEAYIGGWTSMHMTKKMEFMKANHYLDEQGRYTKSSLLAAVSKKKQHVISMVEAQTGKTIILSVPNPITKNIIEQVLEAHTDDLKTLITDESKLYKHIKGVRLEQSNHSKGIFITTGGYSSNAVENRFSWTKRKIQGIYTHTSEKYLQLYLNQIAFAVNHKDDTVMERFNSLLFTCAHARVKNTDVTKYDNLLHYDYEDVYEKETKFAKSIIDSCFFVREVETKHKIKVHR